VVGVQKRKVLICIMLKLMVVTTGRADYGLLYPLLNKLKQSDKITFRLIVTGSHFSSKHGNTYKIIERDGFTINHQIPIEQKEDTQKEVCSSIADSIVAYAKIFESYSTDGMILLGDRYELMAAGTAAMIYNVPIIHIHGGEATFGCIDDTIRHTITKMASLHFTSIPEYARRVIQLGEHPDKVFVVGAIGIDNIVSLDLMSKDELHKSTGVDFNKDVAMMTFHPVTRDESKDAENQIKKVLNSIIQQDFTTLITMPNTDPGGSLIYDIIMDYRKKYKDKIVFTENLGQVRYLSALQHSKLMIGNSSSGILESASFKIPVVNIGDRQKGRVQPANILNCECNTKDINVAIKLAVSSEFATTLEGLVNLYGEGHAAERIIKILENIDYSDKSTYVKKGFYDLPL